MRHVVLLRLLARGVERLFTSEMAVLLCALAGGLLACESKHKSASDKASGGAEHALSATQNAAPQAPPSTQTWQTICTAAEGAAFPAADARGSADLAPFSPGDSRRYYYGIDVPVDYARARKAAFRERELGDGSFAAGTILMMVYANGLGVERNLDLAIKLACEGAEDQARAELQGRIFHLQSMKTPPRGNPFDFCDDVSGGSMEGYCALLAEERRNGERKRALATLSKNWSADQQSSLDAVQGALARFAELRARKERDLSAVDRDMVVAEAEAEVKQAFLDGLKQCEQGALPQYTDDDYRHADEELNRIYKEILGKDFSGSTVTSAGIKAVEKAWISYRDAWLVLATKRYAQAPMVAFKTWLTRQRTAQLRLL